MKILHIIHPDTKFAEGAARFINDCNINKDHYILYINTIRTNSLIVSDIDTRQKEIIIKDGNDWKNIIRAIKICNRFDYVFFHSLFYYYQFKLAVAATPSLLKKIVWIGFGGDLYNSSGLRNSISYIPTKLIANRCYGYVGIFPPDLKEFRRRFPMAKAKLFYAQYMGGKMPEEYGHYNSGSHLSKSLADNGPITVLIGNCADVNMGHKEVLEYLSRFVQNDIQIIIPLSYGDMKYGEEIENESRRIFGNKVICLRKMMTEDDYFEYLKCVDIAIFNVQRQQALGNINRMVFRNVKLFLPEGSVMYDFYKGNGVPVSKVSELKSMTFEQFKSLPVIENSAKFKRFIRKFYSYNFTKEKWMRIYNDLEV